MPLQIEVLSGGSCCRVFHVGQPPFELDGEDLRRDPLEARKATLASMIARAGPGIRLNEHIEEDGPIVFNHACKLGLEGIVSNRKDSSYRSGRSRIGSSRKIRRALRWYAKQKKTGVVS